MKYFFTIAITLLLSVASLSAQWQMNGNVVCGAPGPQFGIQSISDGNGGAFIVWQDDRTDAGDIYAQHLSANGQPLWMANGVVVCNATGGQSYPRIAIGQVPSSGYDLYVSWEDRRAKTRDTFVDIYVQHLRSSDGNAVWTANGVRLTTTTNAYSSDSTQFGLPSEPKITTTSSGDPVVVWVSAANFSDTAQPSGRLDIVAQKINYSNGSTAWTQPVLISGSNPQIKESPSILSIGTDLFFTWTDFRNNTNTPDQPTAVDVYYQRLNSQGTALFTAGGMKVTSPGVYNLFSTGVSDNSSGANISWIALAVPQPPYDIYCQHINSLGAPTWASTGVKVGPFFPGGINTVSDRSSGLVIAAQSSANPDANIYAQRVDATGALKYGTNGVTVCNRAGNQIVLSMEADSSYGVYIAWNDSLNPQNGRDVYAQRIRISDGQAQWTVNGVPATLAKNSQLNPSLTISQGGNIIVSFVSGDLNQPGTLNIVANQIKVDGTSTADVKMISDVQPRSLTLAQNYPNPFNEETQIMFSVPTSSHVTAEVFNTLGERVRTVVDKELSEGEFQVPFSARALPNGMYTIRISNGSESATRAMNVIH